MIIVSVLLQSARTGEVTELARMHIANAGGTDKLGDYDVVTLHGRSTEALNRRVPQRRGRVLQHQRRALHVWHLVAKALKAVGYGSSLGARHSDGAQALLPSEAGEVSASARTEGS